MPQQRPSRLIALLIMMSMILFSCEALPINQNAGLDAAAEQEQQSGRTPEETARLFLGAWAEEDFEAMYRLISPRLLDVYPYEEFRAQYTNTHAEMDFSGVEYAIDEVELQGTSAAIHYDVTLESESFGNIEDHNRIMRLVAEGDGWHIAWSPMDIFNGMTSSVRLRSDRRFPRRGTIYDRNGLPLVQDVGTTLALYLREQDIRNEDDCYDLLAQIMFRPRPYFVSLGTNYLPDTVYFVGEIDSEMYTANRPNMDAWCGTDVDVEGFGSKIQQVGGRGYFGHGAIAHVTGYVAPVTSDRLTYWEARGYTSRDVVGQDGIEFAYQDELAGRPEQFLRLIDTSGGTILRELGGAVGEDPVPVQLTIDRQLQLNLAQAFNDGWNYSTRDWSSVATGGGGIVMDVDSGAILALFSYPTYDPRIFNPDSKFYQTYTEYAAAAAQIGRATGGDPFFPVGSALSNHVISEQYSPGSTFKILTTLAAADSGVWSRNQEFECELEWEGQQRFGDALAYREDWRKALEEEAAGLVNMPIALATSCNPFFWEVGALMYEQNPNLLAEYARQFGFGEATGVTGMSFDEATGNIPNPVDVTDALNNAIGQGNTQVTLVQMARLTAAVANGGDLYRPYIVEQVGGFDGTEVRQDYEPQIIRQLGVSEEALAIARDGMCEVPVNREFGTSYGVFSGSETRPSYSTCGKTGTAQSGAFAPHSWYVSFAPADDPQIAIVVLVTNSREGSEVAAPIVRRFLDMYFDTSWADWPDWWQTPYVPLTPPQGVGN